MARAVGCAAYGCIFDSNCCVGYMFVAFGGDDVSVDVGIRIFATWLFLYECCCRDAVLCPGVAADKKCEG